MISMIKRWFAKDKSVELFRTHTLPIMNIKVGDVYKGNIVTKIESLSPTRLYNGGTAECWVVYGYKEEQR